jgi:hypothetical protein
VLRRTKKSRTSKFREDGRPRKIVNWTVFTAFSGPVSPARYEGALGDVNEWRERNNLPPLAGEHLKECEREVISAVRSVEYFKECAPFVDTPKNYKKMLQKDARALRKAAEVRSSTRVWELRPLLLEEATMLDRRATVEQPRISARERAVDLAEQLLTRFGENAPGLTGDGPWQHLSAILFGEPGADMFEAMRRSRRASRT